MTTTTPYTIPCTINGDTFDGVQFTVNVNGSPLNLTSSSIVMTLEVVNTPVTFSTSGSQIAIIDAANGIFELSKQIVSIDGYGNFDYKITIYLANGDVRTYIYGSWQILDAV